MRTLDYSPYFRSTIGFDHLFDLLDQSTKLDVGQTYPPYNIERTGENDYLISLAVAGFAQTELEVELKDNLLRVSGKKPDAPNTERQFLHQGIAARNFERRFQLADHIRVAGAKLENGLLELSLKREVPEALKPRKIEIGAPKAQVIENKAA